MTKNSKSKNFINILTAVKIQPGQTNMDGSIITIFPLEKFQWSSYTCNKKEVYSIAELCVKSQWTHDVLVLVYEHHIFINP